MVGGGTQIPERLLIHDQEKEALEGRRVDMGEGVGRVSEVQEARRAGEGCPELGPDSL
jgi:hypothetical protein